MIFEGYGDFVGSFILMNGVVFLNYYIVIDHNKWRFMVIKRDIRVYIYIYRMGCMTNIYVNHIHMMAWVCLKMCIIVSIFCCPSTNLHIHTHLSVIYIYTYI